MRIEMDFRYIIKKNNCYENLFNVLNKKSTFTDVFFSYKKEIKKKRKDKKEKRAVT